MMKVFFHNDFYQVYADDPAAAAGRMQAIVREIAPHVAFVEAEFADHDDVAAVHTARHIDHVRDEGVYPMAMLAAGGAVQAAETGLAEPCFALIRPPGHHASAGSCWGFCYFNNMAVALTSLKRRKMIAIAYVLDIDLHYGDGTVNILGDKDWVTVYNVESMKRDSYLEEVRREMAACRADLIGISAGFDNHRQDWGSVLETEDFTEIGRLVRAAAVRNQGGCFAILEGGYNHEILGRNALALIQGMSSK
ncbi:MAG: histone deacetylase family protein [Thermodesulfobacteriota bacterium]